MLAAQGFGRPRPGRVTMRQVQQVIDRLAQFQIDSVNVVTRAHYAPLFSRLGSYDTALLDRAAGQAPRRVFEYWGHAACLIDVRLQPALRLKMASAAQDAWGSMVRISREDPGLVAAVLDAVDQYGPASAREIEALVEAPQPSERTDWGWNWSAVKSALEWLFWNGQITAAGRTPSFERRYDLPGRVLPAAISQAVSPSPPDAYRQLTARAASALGITTIGWAAEYFRIPVAAARQAVAELAEDGQLLPVSVAGWRQPAWLWHQARLPRRVGAQALVCPFDPLLFDRARLKAVLGTDYRIEIYVPAAKRRHGYYVYCLLLGEAIAARFDLKADRQAGLLRVQAAWSEDGHPSPVPEVLAAAVAELHVMAEWLELDAVVAEPAGDLASGLISVLARS